VTEWYEGAGVVKSVAGFVDTLTAESEGEGVDVIDAAIGGAGMVVDLVGSAANPLAAVFSAGVGWLLEHISFIREPLDALLGNPDEMAAQYEALGKTMDGTAAIYALSGALVCELRARNHRGAPTPSHRPIRRCTPTSPTNHRPWRRSTTATPSRTTTAGTGRATRSTRRPTGSSTTSSRSSGSSATARTATAACGASCGTSRTGCRAPGSQASRTT
jgi:hypothetical protein